MTPHGTALPIVRKTSNKCAAWSTFKEWKLFKHDPDCRVFLSTDSGSTGLNLQNASVVVNCDLPGDPARLEQRIARAWRKHQTKSVTVIHLVSQNTIEQRMLETLHGQGLIRLKQG